MRKVFKRGKSIRETKLGRQKPPFFYAHFQFINLSICAHALMSSADIVT